MTHKAEIIQNIIVAGAPELISMEISRYFFLKFLTKRKTPNLLYATDNDTLFRVRFYLREKTNKNEKASNDSFLKH